MSANFRNIQDDGKWKAGGTYTFEVYEPFTQGEYGGCMCEEQPGAKTTGSVLLGDEGYFDGSCGISASPNGNVFFDNKNEDANGGINNTPYISREDMEDYWTKYTITLPENLPNGKYYFKRVDCDYCEAIT